jgi:hypothetical protein
MTLILQFPSKKPRIRTVASCVVDGCDFEVTFLDGEATDIHKLSLRRRRDTIDTVDLCRRKVWRADGGWCYGNVSEELAKRIVAATLTPRPSSDPEILLAEAIPHLA